MVRLNTLTLRPVTEQECLLLTTLYNMIVEVLSGIIRYKSINKSIACQKDRGTNLRELSMAKTGII